MKKPECHLSGLPQDGWFLPWVRGKDGPWVTFHPCEPSWPSRSHLELVWLFQAPSEFIVTLLSSLFKKFPSVTNTVNISAQKYCDGINNNFIPTILMLFTSHNHNSRKAEKNVDITACFFSCCCFWRFFKLNWSISPLPTPYTDCFQYVSDMVGTIWACFLIAVIY